MRRTRKTKHPTSVDKNGRRRLIVICTLLVVATLGVSTFFLFKNSTRTVQVDTPQTDRQSTQSDKATNSTGTASIGTTKGSSDDINAPSASPQLATGVTPLAPSGTFVSNHHPSLSGNTAPNIITSTCITTPGALCTIRFTNGQSTKALPGQRVNSDGYTTWTWKLQDVGVTATSWQITAIASNADKSSSSTDAMNLEVAE